MRAVFSNPIRVNLRDPRAMLRLIRVMGGFGSQATDNLNNPSFHPRPGWAPPPSAAPFRCRNMIHPAALDEVAGPWHVLHTKSRQKKALASTLAARDVSFYMPLIRKVQYYSSPLRKPKTSAHLHRPIQFAYGFSVYMPPETAVCKPPKQGAPRPNEECSDRVL